jgi:hypothetical protein
LIIPRLRGTRHILHNHSALIEHRYGQLFMSTPDFLLISWWLFAAFVGVSGFLFAKRQSARHQRATILALLRNNSSGRYGIFMAATVAPRTCNLVLTVLIVVLVLTLVGGLIAFMWMSQWTNLLLFNFLFLMILGGLACVGVGISASASATIVTPTLLPRSLMRPLMILIGLVALGFGSYVVVGDLTLPRLIVEGRVDGASHSWSKRDTFSITIDGKRYDALRDAFLAVRAGERVRAEVGAGSKTILQVEPIQLRAQ